MKTRLNRDKRDALQRLARKVVLDTPIDPATEKRVAKARTAYDKTFGALVTEATALLAKALSDADRKVLKKHDLLSNNYGQTQIRFVNIDSRDQFEVKLFNKEAFNRTHDGRCASYDEREVYRKAKEKALNKVRVTLPDTTGNRRPITASKRLITLHNKMRGVEDELDIASGADNDRRQRIMSDFLALIEGSRNYEDVIEVWPEAKEVADQIVGEGKAISVMSDEAIQRIKDNMKVRGV